MIKKDIKLYLSTYYDTGDSNRQLSTNLSLESKSNDKWIIFQHGNDKFKIEKDDLKQALEELE